MRRVIPLILSSMTLLTSCAVYNKKFECPINKGVGCKSISEIEAMIVENREGADLFLGGEKVSGCKECSRTTKPSLFVTEEGKWVVQAPKKIHRIWIGPKTLASGHHVEGHYLYFSTGEDQWDVLDPVKGESSGS